MDGYDPWRALCEFDGVHLVIAELPGRRRGQIDYQTSTITLHADLGPVERRCTLAHELVHLERGPVIVRLTPREERVVAATAARRLVPLAALAEAMRWSDDQRQIADELAVDERTVRVRLATLTDDERARLTRLLPTPP